MMGSIYVYKRYFTELDRWRMYERKELLKDMPGHHFSNRGGVLLMKEFVGFEKYYKNDAALMSWYSRAYPQYFGESQQAAGGSVGHH